MALLKIGEYHIGGRYLRFDFYLDLKNDTNQRNYVTATVEAMVEAMVLRRRGRVEAGSRLSGCAVSAYRR